MRPRRQEYFAALLLLMPKHGQSKSTPETGALPDDSDPPAPPPTEQPQWSRWVAPAALVCALIAIVLSAWALSSPANESITVDAPPEPPPVTDQQIADAEARACAAFYSVRGAVVRQTNADASSGPAGVAAAAANARLALAAGGTYLRAHLDPVTPPPLALAIGSFAEQLEDIAINQLAGVANDDPAQAARLADADTAMTQLADICS